ncbi:MAG: transglutaminase domain-containing protein, partial [Chloroflexales bacterium]|nr:transglutaminase domain-containing protein [Chloroflexales bacterium]
MATITVTLPPFQRSARDELTLVLPGFLLALMMTWSVVQSIANAGWATGLGLLVWVALPAVALGTLFARISVLPTWLAHLMSAALGLAWSVQQLGGLLGPDLITWKDRASELLIRAIVWGRVLQSGGRGEDIVLFVAALALLAWMLGYSTGWLLFRRSWTWFAVLINAVTILVNYTFVLPKPNGLFFTFLAVALLLLVYQNVAQKQARWQEDRVDFPDFMSLRFITAAALFCGAVIAVTSVLPGTVTSTQVARAWQTMSSPLTTVRERWEDAFSTINAPPGTSGGGFAVRGAALGGARVLSDAPVMYVRSSHYDYWRAVAADRYTGREWQNTTGEDARATLGLSTPEQARTPLEPGVALPGLTDSGRTPVTQTVELAQDRRDNFIMVGGQALQVSLPTLVEHAVDLENGRPTPNFADTSAVFSQLPLRAGGVYTVTALTSSADEQSLREAAATYPAWVTARYLQLPDTISLRTVEKAQEVVAQAGANNNYDKAMAIQSFLRSFPYNQQIQAAPTGQDAVDYFLFDLRQGYCDYYASAMVVMLRSQGIPARWVQGYAGGTRDMDRDAYLVRENIAHSWPEVYFPDLGWQRFEPTPASYTSLPDRPATPEQAAREYGDSVDNSIGSSEFPIPQGDNLSEEDELRRQRAEQELSESREAFEARQRQEMIQQLAVVGVLLAALVGVLAFLVLRYERRLRALGPVAGTWARLELLAGWAGLPLRPDATP